MAEIVYATSDIGAEGPWLIDYDKLETLENVVNEHWDLLQAAAKPEIVPESIAESDPELHQKMCQLIENMRRFKPDKKFEIHLSRKKRLIVSSFQEANKHPSVYDDLPTGIDVHIECEQGFCEMSLSDSGVHIWTIPKDNSEMQNLAFALWEWAASVRPSKWLQIWQHRIAALDILMPIVIISWIFVGYQNIQRMTQLSAIQAKHAKELLKNGLDKNQEHRAIEFLLTSASKTGTFHFHFPTWIILLCVLTLAVCVILSIRPPRVVVGIGKGKDVIHRWRTWIKFLFYILPTFVFGSFIVPLLWKLIERLL